MSATLLWSTSPIMLGRPSSPLNPHSSTLPSSSSPPASSPTPQHTTLPSFSLSLGSPSLKHRPSSSPSLRYTRPNAKRSSTSPFQPPSGSSRGIGTADLFAEGTTPVESAMWKERFARRVKDREKRKRIREEDLDKRRSLSRDLSLDGSDEIMDEDEADRQAAEDDEEIFRRLMILQKRRANHQSLVSYEVETGGSDPALPDFWEEELDQIQYKESEVTGEDRRIDLTPTRSSSRSRPALGRPPQDEEDEWARQAAEAEEAEREMEESEVARRVEEAYGLTVPKQAEEVDMAWEAFDAMDIE